MQDFKKFKINLKGVTNANTGDKWKEYDFWNKGICK